MAPYTDVLSLQAILKDNFDSLESQFGKRLQPSLAVQHVHFTEFYEPSFTDFDAVHAKRFLRKLYQVLAAQRAWIRKYSKSVNDDNRSFTAAENSQSWWQKLSDMFAVEPVNLKDLETRVRRQMNLVEACIASVQQLFMVHANISGFGT